jgi:hypothetical protein
MRGTGLGTAHGLADPDLSLAVVVVVVIATTT